MFISNTKADCKQCLKCRSNKITSHNNTIDLPVEDDKVNCTNCTAIYNKADMNGYSQCLSCRTIKANYLRKLRAKATQDNTRLLKTCTICFNTQPLIEFKGKRKECKCCQTCRDKAKQKRVLIKQSILA